MIRLTYRATENASISCRVLGTTRYFKTTALRWQRQPHAACLMVDGHGSLRGMVRKPNV